MPDLKIPASPKDMTPEWLIAALQIGGGEHMADISAVDLVPVEENVGFVSSLYRAGLHYSVDAPSAPTSVIVKFTSEDEKAKAGAKLMDLYRREVNFYRYLAADCPANPPQCFYADVDDTGENFALVIEDIPGFDEEKWRTGCTLEEAGLVVGTLGRMHAKYWLDPPTEKYDWIRTFKSSVGDIGSLMAYGIPNFLKDFGHIMPERLRAGLDGIVAAFPALAQIGAESPLQCLSHADTHLGNLIFQDDRVRFIDWQAYILQSFCYDVAYFINGNMAIEDRRQHLDELLDIYHENLTAGGITLITREALSTHYRLQTMAQWVGIPMIIGGFMRDDEKGRETAEVWALRFFAAMEDQDVPEFFNDLMAGKVTL